MKMKLQHLWVSTVAFLLALTISGFALAAQGTESGGGGDPDAVDFLLKVKAIGEWALRTSAGVSDSDAETINSNAKKLVHLMDDPRATPISMVEQELYDTSGASKIAIFDLNLFKVQITRSKWKALNDEDKFVLAALELFGLSQLQDRYEVAGMVKQEFQRIKHMSEVVDQKWSYLSAIKVGGVVTYEAPGIYKSSEEIYPMATNLDDIDVDFDNRVTGVKMAVEYCKALGHESGVSVSFKSKTSLVAGTVGAFFKIKQGYMGLRFMNLSSITPDLAVRHLNCK